MFAPEVFRKQMHCIDESTCDTVGLFGAARSHSGPVSCAPLALPSLRPWIALLAIAKNGLIIA